MVSAAVYAFALVPAVLWGFSPILSKRGMAAGGSSLQAAIVVISVDAAVYWAALLALGHGAPFANAGRWAIGVFVVGGLVGTALGRIAVFAGVHRVGASVNTAAISVRPLFATAIALVWLGEPVGPLTGLGVVVLVTGLLVLTGSRGGDLSGWTIRDLLFPLSAALAFAVGNVIRRFGLTTTDVTVLQAVTLNESAALVALLAFVVATGRQSAVLDAPRATYRYFAGSGLLTAAALLALFEAFDRGPVAVVDSLAGTAPLFTTVFAAVLLGDLERVTKGVVVGAALIVVGAGLITLA
ncbi:MAG: EamA family transporter [Halobacteriales archaeon]